MAAKERYYVAASLESWVVIDRTKMRMHDDVVERHKTRKEARAALRRLNGAWLRGAVGWRRVKRQEKTA